MAYCATVPLYSPNCSETPSLHLASTAEVKTSNRHFDWISQKIYTGFMNKYTECTIYTYKILTARCISLHTEPENDIGFAIKL